MLTHHIGLVQVGNRPLCQHGKGHRHTHGRRIQFVWQSRQHGLQRRHTHDCTPGLLPRLGVLQKPGCSGFGNDRRKCRTYPVVLHLATRRPVAQQLALRSHRPRLRVQARRCIVQRRGQHEVGIQRQHHISRGEPRQTFREGLSEPGRARPRRQVERHAGHPSLLVVMLRADAAVRLILAQQNNGHIIARADCGIDHIAPVQLSIRRGHLPTPTFSLPTRRWPNAANGAASACSHAALPHAGHRPGGSWPAGQPGACESHPAIARQCCP
ncbi:hypothetical protein D3C80_841130 [compost metagenome]